MPLLAKTLATSHTLFSWLLILYQERLFRNWKSLNPSKNKFKRLRLTARRIDLYYWALMKTEIRKFNQFKSKRMDKPVIFKNVMIMVNKEIVKANLAIYSLERILIKILITLYREIMRKKKAFLFHQRIKIIISMC